MPVTGVLGAGVRVIGTAAVKAPEKLAKGRALLLEKANVKRSGAITIWRESELPVLRPR